MTLLQQLKKERDQLRKDKAYLEKRISKKEDKINHLSMLVGYVLGYAKGRTNKD